MLREENRRLDTANTIIHVKGFHRLIVLEGGCVYKGLMLAYQASTLHYLLEGIKWSRKIFWGRGFWSG